MLIRKPDYYDEFSCLADKCEETCCAGWQIVIDDEALEEYKRVESDFASRLIASIDWEEGVFHQDENRRCAFLNENNLCDLYCALGEASLCKTCTNYPRHIEEFENIREYTLSVSCPEAARILLAKKDKAAFSETEDEAYEEYEDFDFLMFEKMEEARETMIHLLQNRTLPVGLRAYLVWNIGKMMQSYIDEGNLFSCEEIFDAFQKEETWKEYKERLEKLQAGRFEETKEYFGLLFELEFLKEDWEVQLAETEAILFQGGEEAFFDLHEEFEEWLKKEYPDYEIWMEQLLVYFIMTYFCGAVYDGYVLSKVKMAVVSVWMIYEMLAAKWLRNECYLDMEEVIMTVYRYSRELEHSDWNLEKMDELLDEE